jgi:DNA-binding NarL/FixJ family response regulator
MEILQSVIEGKTNKAIANERYIMERTVAFHLDHIFIKISVGTRLFAGVWTFQQGIGVKTVDIPSYSKGIHDPNVSI